MTTHFPEPPKTALWIRDIKRDLCAQEIKPMGRAVRDLDLLAWAFRERLAKPEYETDAEDRSIHLRWILEYQRSAFGINLKGDGVALVVFTFTKPIRTTSRSFKVRSDTAKIRAYLETGL